MRRDVERRGEVGEALRRDVERRGDAGEEALCSLLVSFIGNSYQQVLSKIKVVHVVSPSICPNWVFIIEE